MVDVVFLLVVFFMLIAHLTREQRLDLVLPRLRQAQSDEAQARALLVLNVVPGSRAGSAAAYRMGSMDFDATPAGEAGLVAALRAAREREPELRVVVRAERTQAYDTVHPALRAVTTAGLTRVDLAAMPEGHKP